MPQKIPGSPQVDALRALLNIKGTGGSDGGATGATGATGAAGATGATGPSAAQPLGLTALFIDPSNSSGHASDSNSGASSSAPILTTAHLNTLLAFRALTANTTVTYMSDDSGSVALDYGTLSLGSFAFNINGTPQVVHTGGTINAGTIAINPTASGGGQRQVVHTSDLSTFAPYVWTGNGGSGAHPFLLVDLTGGNSGTAAWIVSAATPASPSMSRPITSAQQPGAFTIGDSYQIQRGSVLNIANCRPYANADGSVNVQNFAFGATHIGSCGANYFQCSWEAQVTAGGLTTNCYIGIGAAEFTPMGYLAVSSGVYISTEDDFVSSLFGIGGDAYVTGYGLIISGAAYADVFVFVGYPGIGAGIQLQDTTSTFGALNVQGTLATVFFSSDVDDSTFWGNGNAGAGVILNPGAQLVVSDEVPPSVTGTGGDFAFQTTAGPVKVARAWNDATGAYTEAGGPPTRATTWANFAAAIGSGGFAFQAHDVASSANIVAV